jgi:hypothetical protein
MRPRIHFTQSTQNDQGTWRYRREYEALIRLLSTPTQHRKTCPPPKTMTKLHQVWQALRLLSMPALCSNFVDGKKKTSTCRWRVITSNNFAYSRVTFPIDVQGTFSSRSWSALPSLSTYNQRNSVMGSFEEAKL